MRPRGRAAGGAAVCLVILCALGCSRQGAGDERPVPAETAARRGAALRPVALPDLSRLDPALQQQIRAEYDALGAAPGAAPASGGAEGFGRVGRLLLAAEYPEAAEPFFANARTLNPQDMRWPYYLGHVHRLRNQPEQAVAFFDEARRLEPAHVPSLVWLGDIYLALGQPAAAEPHLAAAAAIEPGSVAAWFGRGRASLATREYAAAVAHLERAVALAPEAGAVHYQLGLAYRGVGDRARAEQHLKRRADAAPIVPADPLMDSLRDLLQTGSAYLARGLDAMERRDWAGAVNHLRKASELSPGDAAVHLNLGTAIFLAGDAAGARRSFETAIRLAPELPKAHYTLGLVAEAEGRDGEAIERFSAAVRLDPAYLDAQASLADALRRTGRVEASLEHYAKVLALDPSASPSRFGYAMALVRLRRYPEARDWLREAVSLHPDQPGIAHALARLLAAAPDDRVRNGREALQIVEQLQRQGASPTLSETMAMALAELGRFEEAVEWQQRAIQAAQAGGRPDMAQRMRADLAAYRNRQPCRTPWRDDDPVHSPRPST